MSIQIEHKTDFLEVVQKELDQYIEEFQDEDDNLVRGLSEETDFVMDMLDEIYEKYDVLMNYSDGTAVTLAGRLKDKLAHGSDMSDASTYSSASDMDKQMSTWIDSLSDDDKRIMLGCEIDKPSLNDCKQYLANHKIAVNTIFVPLDLDEFKSTMTSMESGYQSLLDAKDEFELNGGFLSPSTIANLTGSGLIGYLEQTEAGIHFNTSAYLDNTEAIKQNAIQQLYSAMCHDVEAIAIGNVSEISAGAQANLANAGITAETAGNQASNSAFGWYEYAASLASVKAAMSDDVQGAAGTTKKQIDSTIRYYQNLANIVSNINVDKTTKNNSSVTQSAQESITDWKDVLSKYLELYESELEAGLSDFNTYLTKSKALLEEYYRDGKISAKDYWDETKSLYESQLSIYDKVLSAVDRRFDTEIDRINEIIDGIEEQNESLENQKEIYDSALSAIQNFLDSKKDACQKDIDGIESENDALQTQIDKYDTLLDAVSDVFEEKRNSLENEMNLIQERIDALQEANDAQQKSIELEKARYELERAQNQRTKKVFNGTQFIYEADQSAVRDARDSLSDLEPDTAVDALEQEKEAIQEVIDGLDKLEESWNRIPDIFTKAQNASAAEGLLGSDYRDIILNSDPELIAGIMHDYTNAQQQMEDNNTLIASIEEKMKMLDSLSDKWSGIADERENITNRENAVQLLGQEWEALILEQRQETFDEFRNHYLLIQSQIDDNTSLIESYQQKTEYYELLKEQWSSAADAYENSVNDQYAAMILGQNWESDILNGRVDTLNSFLEQYITIQQAIADAAWASANEQIKAAQEAEKAANGSAGSSGSVGSGNKDGKENNDDKDGNDDNNTRYKVVDEQGRTLVSYHGANAESNAYTFRDNLDDAIHDRDKVDIVPYAAGTNHARKGLGLVGEKGTETFIDNAGNVSLVTKPTLIPMEGGE